jgi:hypothetical protein
VPSRINISSTVGRARVGDRDSRFVVGLNGDRFVASELDGFGACLPLKGLVGVVAEVEHIRRGELNRAYGPFQRDHVVRIVCADRFNDPAVDFPIVMGHENETFPAPHLRAGSEGDPRPVVPLRAAVEHDRDSRRT